MGDPSDIIDSSMLGGLQPIRLPRCRHERPEREHWEATRLTSMRALLNEGDVIYDVGSEMADLSALYALWGCEVVLCEPNPASWPWARLTFEANDVRPKDCWHGFISDAGTEAPGGEFAWDQPWPAAAYGLLDPETGFLTEHERGAEFRSITLDTLTTMVIAPPTAITIDVESYEYEVLVGAKATLAEHRPLVWVSIHPEFLVDRGLSDDAVHGVMHEAQYESRFLSTDHEEHWLFLPVERADELWPR